ncbi:MAG: hypothetical protein LBJ04_17745 [Sphingobacterium sp.]|jgi:hypothetical protein|nr:hypothetical protein [Sphingobacterium sp.]
MGRGKIHQDELKTISIHLWIKIQKIKTLTIMPQEQLLSSIVDYFQQEIFEPHLRNLQNDYANFDSYSANPFLLPYLSKIIEGEYSERGIAKALYLPRVLSSSITTAFGTHIKKILINNNLAESRSTNSNIISFTDHISGLYTACILKAGPNTINSGDKSPIRSSLRSIENVENKAIGIIYGAENELNGSYVNLQEEFDIFVGRQFWQRITGYENFYINLSERLRVLSENLDTNGRFDGGLNRLIRDIPGDIL